MAKIRIIITIWVFIFALPLQANSANYPYSYHTTKKDELLFKIRVHYTNLNSLLEEKLNKNINSTFRNNHSLGGDGSVVYFLNKYIAAELSAGLTFIPIKKDQINEMRGALGIGDEEISDDETPQLYYLPITAIIQYHIAPYGAIRPYLGAGYHGAFFYSRNTTTRIEHSHGPVLQAGINFMLKDDTVLTFDIKQNFLTVKSIFQVTPEEEAADTTPVSSEANLNPLTISVGIGLKF